MKINIYGSNLAAWVAAACLAKVGNDVCLQEDAQQGVELKELSAISVIRDEPGLAEQITRQLTNGRLSRVRCDEVQDVDVHWLALEPNDQLLAQEIIKMIATKGGVQPLIVNQANFEVGATLNLQSHCVVNNTGALFAYIPDNLEQGNALKGFEQPKRLTMGVDSDEAALLAKGLLKPFSAQLEQLQVMSTKEAEFTKFAITGMLAIRLGYINELANLADKLGVDVEVIRSGMGLDPRVGQHYLSPGCGFGGQNFHAYLSKLTQIFEEKGERSLIKTVLDENEVQKELLFRKLWLYYKADLIGKSITIWGAAFKPGTASIDNAPSLRIIDALLSQGVEVRVCDPEAIDNLKAHYGEALIYHSDIYQAVKDSDALLLVTQWPEYLSPDYKKLVKLMRKALIIDGRNVFDKATLKAQGIEYIGVGR